MHASFEYFFLIFELLLLTFGKEYGTSDLKFCTILSESQSESRCEEIEKLTDGKIKCVFAIDRLRCLEQLFAKTADFAVLKAEDLYLAQLLNNTEAEKLVVTNEFRRFAQQKYEFDMVVLVSNQVEINSLADLADKRLCHPGFDENGWLYDWSNIFSENFEKRVVPEQCDPALNVLENKIKSLSSFFGSSCKPGSWSPIRALDEKLKKRYSKLCEMCKISESCSNEDMYWGLQGPLTCLTDCSGDVTWVRLQDIQIHFETFGFLTCTNVSFLCPNGTKLPLNTTDPCVWISRPWPVLVSRRSVAENVSTLVSSINKSNDRYIKETWQYKFRSLLGYSLQPIQSVEMTGLSPIDYLKKVTGFLKANSMHVCQETGADKVIIICTDNDFSLEKCNLMANVAHVYSIDPKFQCVMENNCLDRIARNLDHVVIVSTEHLTQVYENYSLKPILYQISDKNKGFRSSFVVVPQSSTVKKLKELRGKKACFTSVGGLGWNSFLMALKEKSLIDDYCDGKSQILKFFSDVCIIDQKSDDEIRSCFDKDEMFYIKDEIGTVELNEAQGLRCITEGGGDVTFIDFNLIDKYLYENKNEDWVQNLKSQDFRTICPYKDNCYLSQASYGQVLVHRNISENREEEIMSAFLILSSLLGSDMLHSHNSPIFKLFTHYKNERNILFESSASQLESAEEYFRRQWKSDSYELKLQDMEKVCKKKRIDISSNGSHSLLISISVILYFLPIFYLTISF